MRHYFQDKSARLGKRERTRSILIDGAIATIAERGLQGASIKEIASAAGVANGTFYNHFEDRDQILREAAAAVAKELTDDVARMVADVHDGIGRIIISTNAFIEKAVAAPDWGRLIVDAAHHAVEVRHEIGEHFHNDVALAIEQGRIDEVPPPFLVHQIGALIALAIELQIREGKDERILAQTCEAVLKLLGLSPARARRAVEKHLNHKCGSEKG